MQSGLAVKNKNKNSSLLVFQPNTIYGHGDINNKIIDIIQILSNKASIAPLLQQFTPLQLEHILLQGNRVLLCVYIILFNHQTWNQR